MKRWRLFVIIKHAIIPLLFYLISFCLLTYPLILKFSTHFFADSGDGLQNVWNIWWINLAVRHPNLYSTIWQTPLLHWPFGVTLYGQTLNPFNGLLAVLLLQFLSLIEAHNLIVIFAFVMGGLTMYWLAFYVSKSFWGSLLAGFVFTFSSFHFMHAQGHLQQVSLEWLPLFLLCWLSLLDNPHTLKGMGAAILLWLVMLCDYYFLFYSVLTAVLIFIWYAIIHKDILFIFRKAHFQAFLIFVVFSLLLVVPIIATLFIINHRDPLLGYHNPAYYSLDLLAIVIPGGHWFFNQWTSFYWSKLPGNINESSVYISLPVFFFAGFAWFKRKTLAIAERHSLYLWLILSVFFLLLALGPELQINTWIIWRGIMPYTLLVDVFPFLKLSGVPVRMMVMVTLGASVLSAVGFRELLGKSTSRLIGISVLLALLIFETLPKPLPATEVVVPDYVKALAALPNNNGVLDEVTNNLGLELFYQTVHMKPIAFGYVSRLPTSVNQEEDGLKAAVDNKNYEKLWSVYHIRYIVTHDFINSSNVAPYITIELVYDKSDVRIYRIGCVCENGK